MTQLSVHIMIGRSIFSCANRVPGGRWRGTSISANLIIAAQDCRQLSPCDFPVEHSRHSRIGPTDGNRTAAEQRSSMGPGLTLPVSPTPRDVNVSICLRMKSRRHDLKQRIKTYVSGTAPSIESIEYPAGSACRSCNARHVGDPVKIRCLSAHSVRKTPNLDGTPNRARQSKGLDWHH